MRLAKAIAVLTALMMLMILSSTRIYAASSAVIEPCEVITQADAEMIMGEKMQPGQEREQQAVGLKLCVYEPVDTNSFTMLQLSIIQGQSAKDIYLEIKSNLPYHEKIMGIGEDAFVGTPGIHILKSNCYLSIAAGNLKRNRDKVLAAGKKAAAYLEAQLQ